MVRVIRRHHPLRGRELEVLSASKRMILVRHPDSLTMRIPRDWTDADGVPLETPNIQDTRLTVVSLRELIHLVDVLGGRA
jgi:hypothetical protein